MHLEVHQKPNKKKLNFVIGYVGRFELLENDIAEEKKSEKGEYGKKEG